jgi:hypothetical protein
MKLNATIRRRLQRNFERRFGQSMWPLTIREKSTGIFRVFDPETGTWADYTLGGSRLRRIAELDQGALQ